METGKLYSIFVKKKKKTVQGILLNESDEWIMLRNLWGDYIIDGIVYIRKKFISHVSRAESEIFIEDVLKASGKWDVNLSYKIPQDSVIDLCKYLYEKHITIQIRTGEERVLYVGKIKKILSKSFYLKPLSPEGLWEEESYLFRLDGIRMIEFDNDYINSLLAYNHHVSCPKTS